MAGDRLTEVPRQISEANGFSWFQWHRLEWIDEMLRVYGFINRGHICRKFDLSVPAASNDLRIFKGLFPDEIVYDRSAKCYRAAGRAALSRETET